MARLGLGDEWTCLFANDIDADKACAYRANWGGAELVEGDLGAVSARKIPGRADLAWASFPCQDLSLAGGGKGMGAADDAVKTRSGAFWLFHEKMRALAVEGRAPRAIVLENVVGVLSSHGKRDFCALVEALDGLCYRVGALTLDARWFTPQSRPRVFFVAVQKSLSGSLDAQGRRPDRGAGSPALDLRLAARRLWRAAESLGRKLDLVAPAGARAPRRRSRRSARRRTRRGALARARRHRAPAGADGAVPSSENRGDTGKRRPRCRRCLSPHPRRPRRGETAKGGSSLRRSRRLPAHARAAAVRARPSSKFIRTASAPACSRRARRRGSWACLNSYILPRNPGAAYELCGDGLCVPVVRHLAEHLLQPLLREDARRPRAAAEKPFAAA